MEPKILYIMIDGLADVSNASINNKTYLQYSKKPTLDNLANAGLTGLIDPVETGLACGSDVAHMSIFGYEPFKNYQGRGSFETLGAGLDLGYDDIAFKCNFATLDPESGLVTRRRVSRQFYKWGLDLCRYLDDREIPGYPGYKINVLHATEHRCGLKIVGQNLSHQIEGTDPLKDNLPLREAKALDPNDRNAVNSANIVNALSHWIYEELSKHPINQERVREHKPPANILLLRGCGVKLRVPTFRNKHNLKSFFIAPTAIIKGLAMTLGADVINVPGTTGDIHSNFQAKFDRAIELFREDYEFGFVHIKAIDDLGHDKNLDDRITMIENIDKIIGGTLKTLGETYSDMIVVVGGDHTTNIHIGDHSFEPVPFIVTRLEIYKALTNGEDISREALRDNVQAFNEIDCAKGVLGRFPGSEVMEFLKNLRQRIKQINSS
ncbi:unnamed protein product [Blepharisma stoltei]|uniref:Metalloenzyme domain-containing protein n=1 Tax=Blepharisma stoltei TaxID=1481888 RepID=A0AAU9IBZ7_9CILI|nr:unnamed protein product [Blepharisma stoltei]